MGWISHARRATVLSLAVTALLAAAPLGQAAVNHPPNVPHNLRIAAPRDAHCGPDHRPTVVGDTPAIQATLTDPDGRARRLGLRVEVYAGLTGPRVWVGLSPRVLNPSTARMSLSSTKVTDQMVYRWRVRADDTIVAGKWSTFCYFQIDRIADGSIDSVDYPHYYGTEQGYSPEEGEDKGIREAWSSRPVPPHRTRSPRRVLQVPPEQRSVADRDTHRE